MQRSHVLLPSVKSLIRHHFLELQSFLSDLSAFASLQLRLLFLIVQVKQVLNPGGNSASAFVHLQLEQCVLAHPESANRITPEPAPLPASECEPLPPSLLSRASGSCVLLVPASVASAAVASCSNSSQHSHARSQHPSHQVCSLVCRGPAATLNGHWKQ
jgi:hypothetical protein